MVVPKIRETRETTVCNNNTMRNSILKERGLHMVED